MRHLLRFVYRGILQLHPQDFRVQFGNEMLWIFDQEMHDEESRSGTAALRLVLDGMLSILIQNVRPRIQPQIEAAGPIYREVDSAIPAERYAQATLVILCCTLSLTLFLSMVVPRVSVSVKGLLYTPIHLLSSIQSDGR
jgi:hypothetical protein